MWRTILPALIASALAAQMPSLSISGVVADKLGPLPGVRVIVTGSGRHRTHTDEKGRYRFDGLRAGDYRVLAAIKGFRSQWRDTAMPADPLHHARRHSAGHHQGQPPSSILIDQIGAGMCLKDDGFEFAGADRPFAPREEYIAFMRRDGDRFASLRGPLLMFKVGNGVVETRQYGDLPATLPLTEFYAAVRRMGR